VSSGEQQRKMAESAEVFMKGGGLVLAAFDASLRFPRIILGAFGTNYISHLLIYIYILKVTLA
jgi:hypothetical protein